MYSPATFPWARVASGLVLGLFLFAAAAQAAIVVESVEAANLAAEAGVQPGDLLLRWERDTGAPLPAVGSLDSPYDLWRVEIEQAPRGPVRIHARRGVEAVSFEIRCCRWRLSTRPDFSAEDVERFRRGETLSQESPKAALEIWASLAAELERKNRQLEASWLLERMAEVAGLAAGGEFADRAAALARARGDRGVEAQILRALGVRKEGASDLAGGIALHQRALALAREENLATGSGRLLLAQALADLGALSWKSGAIEVAIEALGEGLEIRRQEAPGSPAVGAALNDLAIAELIGGDYLGGSRHLFESLELLMEVAPDSQEMLRTRNNLAVFSTRSGRFEAAIEHYWRALEIVEKLDGGSPNHAAILANLSELASNQGDLAQAENYVQAALEIQARLGLAGLEYAASLSNLGQIRELRGELESALELYQESVEIREEVAPGGFQVAMMHASICEVAVRLGRTAEAEAGFRDAVRFLEDHPSEGVHVAESLRMLGSCRAELGDHESAEEMYSRGLALARAKVPGSRLEAQSLNSLAEVHWVLGRPEEAAREFRQALEIGRRIVPDGLDVAVSHHGLAEIHRGAGAAEAATEHYEAAAAALEEQSLRLGGEYEAWAKFQQRTAALYKAYVGFLLEENLGRDAFQVLERSRARAFRTLLGARRVQLPRALAPELEQEEEEAVETYDRVLAELATVGAGAPDELVAEVQSRLVEARRRRDDARARVWAAAPRLAELERPETLDPAQAIEALGVGTVLLSFFVDQEASHLFALGPGPSDFEAYPIAAGEAELEREVARFRSLLGQAGDLELLRARAQALSRQLLQPAAASIERAERVLIAPDGPLQSLPFAALTDPIRPESFFVEDRPLTVVASATVYSQLARRKRRGSSTLAAFGDPSYPGTEVAKASTGLRTAFGRDLPLNPLPGTRLEVEAISDLFPDSSSVFLGERATEERAKSLPRDASLIHFACHAVADPRFPLESALVLSIPEKPSVGAENGLLQAWEILEEVELEADLVTLSACETARGAELAGEGLIGLTRAFQFAGARAVLASQWSVGDVATAELMVSFYRHLKAGAATDEALRRAQLELLEARDTPARFRHPFFWAAFELNGDWR